MTSKVVFQVFDGGLGRHIPLEKSSPAYKAMMAVFEAERQSQPGNHVKQITMTSRVVFQVCDGETLRQIQLKKTSAAFSSIMAVFEAERKRTHRLSKRSSTAKGASSKKELKGLRDNLTTYFTPDSSSQPRTVRNRCSASAAPEFSEKPKIVRKDNVIIIKARAKSHTGALKAEWFKDNKPIKGTVRVKITQKQDARDKDGTQYTLEITNPTKGDEAEYKIVIKNAAGRNQQTLQLVFG